MRPAAELYQFNLREAIPQFLLPLQPEDQKPIIDLAEVLRQISQDAALDMAIDYSQPPAAPIEQF